MLFRSGEHPADLAGIDAGDSRHGDAELYFGDASGGQREDRNRADDELVAAYFIFHDIHLLFPLWYCGSEDFLDCHSAERYFQR